jgi:2-oxoglutarate ferredoxin oxidoreductase subunit gamma
MAKEEIRVSGFGGQGVILTAYIIGKAATLFANRYATMTQAFGPEARGSSCSAQVILDDKPVRYPYLTRTSILVTLSQESYNIFSKSLAPGGMLMYEEDLVKTGALPEGVRAYAVPATRLAEEKIGKSLFTNIVVIGFFAAVAGLLDPKALRGAVESSVPKGTEALNLKAFDAGYDFGVELLKKTGGGARKTT